MSIYEFFHYSLFLGLFLAFTYFKKQPPAFGAALAYWSILVSFLSLLFSASNFVNGPSLARVDQLSALKSSNRSRDRSLVDYVFGCERSNPALIHQHAESERVPLASYQYGSSWEGKRINPLLRMSRDYQERSLSMDSGRIGGVIGIGLFFSAFLAASSDPFMRNFFVCTEPLSSLNPVLQDPILAIHPPCIYAGEVASGVDFVLCRAKLTDGIVAFHSRPMRKVEKSVTAVYSSGCVGSVRNVNEFAPFKAVEAQCYPVGMLRRKIAGQRQGSK